MSISQSIESARFPVHKSGGYQISAVDDLLTDVLTQAKKMERDADDSAERITILESDIKDLRTSLADERSKYAELESRVEQAAQSTEDSDPSALAVEVAELQIKVRSLQKSLDEAKEQLSADEKHIKAMEEYADEVERKNEALRSERDKLQHDAEEAIRTLAAQVANAPSPEPLPQSAPPASIEQPAPPAEAAPEKEPRVDVNDAPAPSIAMPYSNSDTPNDATEDGGSFDSPNDVDAAPGSPLPSGTFEDDNSSPSSVFAGERDATNDERVHMHTPSVTTPVTGRDDVDTDSKRPRLMRRSRP